MEERIVAALIALTGVLVSVVLSYHGALRASKSELAKQRLEVLSQHALRLYEERLACYPELFKALSDFMKVLEFGALEPRHVKELLPTIDEWDSQHAILLSEKLVATLRNVRIDLRELSELSEEEFAGWFYWPYANDNLSPMDLLKREIANLEQSLRSEIGANTFPLPGETVEPIRRRTRYSKPRRKR